MLSPQWLSLEHSHECSLAAEAGRLFAANGLASDIPGAIAVPGASVCHGSGNKVLRVGDKMHQSPSPI